LSRKSRLLTRSLIALVAAYVTAAAGLFVVMCQPPARFGRIMRHLPLPVVWGVLPGPLLWGWARGGNLEAGEPAPDFDLKLLDGERRVKLSSFEGHRPVVLVFGSYT
jgi:hypothetical protein